MYDKYKPKYTHYIALMMKKIKKNFTFFHHFDQGNHQKMAHLCKVKDICNFVVYIGILGH